MSILYAETFAGANANPIGGVWTTITGFAALQRVSNALDGSTGDSAAYVSSVTPANDHYASVTMDAAALTTDGGPIVRAATGAKTHYLLDIAGTTQIYKVSAGVYTGLGSTFAYTKIAGDVWQLRAVGTTMSAWLNGVQKLSVVDAVIASGRFGVFVAGTSQRYSAFEGGDFNVVGGTQFVPRRAHLQYGA